MSKKKITKNYLIISIALTVFSLILNMLVDLITDDRILAIEASDKAEIFFTFTLVTIIALIVQIKGIFIEKNKRIIKSFLILITLYALYYQLLAAIFINFF